MGIALEKGKPVGAVPRGDGQWEFCVWAPKRERVELHILEPGNRCVEMNQDAAAGYFTAVVPELSPGARYMYRLDGEVERPDPASRFQADGVHEASQTVDPGHFAWSDHAWRAPRLEGSIFYELHVGTFTREGTFDAVVERLPALLDLGVTTIELMPVAQFPGTRNWGYDGVFPYAAQNSYGGPEGLQRLVNAAHEAGLAVALDVVYNHLGPEGNYLGDYGPYFASKYKTGWGQAINFDGEESVPVRRFFIDNAIYWFENFHIDVLRLDAIHAIFDFSAYHFLAELKDRVCEASERLGRPLLLIAESDLNDSRILRGREQGGYALQGQWSDDFHHAVHSLLTGESQGYYADFSGVGDLATVLEKNWLYRGQYSKFRRRRHGDSAEDLDRSRFVVCTQNHDQVGNRAWGERLAQLVDFEAQKLAAGILLLSPFTPMLFMGEEYGETAPFQYFVSHGDKELIEAVRHGRASEFAEFDWAGEVPDPQAPATFLNSTLKHLENQEPHKTLRRFYKTLIQFRKQHRLFDPSKIATTAIERANTLAVKTFTKQEELSMIFNFGEVPANATDILMGEPWVELLSSWDSAWLGPGPVAAKAAGSHKAEPLTIPSCSFTVYQRALSIKGEPFHRS